MALFPVLALIVGAVNPLPFAPGEICTAAFESHPEFSLDGKTMYFVKSTPQFTDWKIYESHLSSGHWSSPQPAPFSGKYRDADPFITTDGKRMFFISDRPHPDKKDSSMDIWVMDRKGSGWGDPARLGPEVNSETDEWYPTLTRNGTLYFGSSRIGTLGNCDLWMSRLSAGKFQEAVNLGPPINTAADDIEPFISPDGKLLIFNSTREGSLGGLDFFTSRLSGGKWSEPKPLPAPINGRATELSPKLSRDGKRFFFTGMRRGRLGEILVVPTAELGL